VRIHLRARYSKPEVRTQGRLHELTQGDPGLGADDTFTISTPWGDFEVPIIFTVDS
jgi:hypothetical protein